VSEAKIYRTLFISDIHLGSRNCQADLLLDFLRHHDAETIYLVGDIFDGWRLKRSWYWPQSHNDIVQKLKSGASFEEMSMQYSLAPNAKKGGEIGYVSRGELPKMFEDEIFALKPGDVSGVIRTESSFHIFKVADRRPPGTIDLPTATPVIRERLKDDAIRDRLAELVNKAKGEAQTAVLTRRLPFRYSGTLPKNENE